MPAYSHIIFDLDGTLVNSKIGLTNSLNYMLTRMSIDMDSATIIDQMIGPPIQDGLKEVLDFDARQVELGISLFREYYSETGLYEGELYPGILELLEELQQLGTKLFVATSKKDLFVPAVLRHFELGRYVSDFEGSGDGGKHTKAGLMGRNQIIPSEKVVMVGDTKYDVVGGKANEIGTIAVGYGFGNSEELRALNPDYFAGDVEELCGLLV
jgi:phosphoglycolate phosphatase